jgi:hypothetical protein
VRQADDARRVDLNVRRRLRGRIVELGAGALGEAAGALREGGALAVNARGAIDAGTAAAWARAVLAARAEWNSDFGGAQHSLGRAWYTHLEQERTEAYFREAAASDAIVERACPGLARTMRELAARVVGQPVAARAGWCGPGVHVFPAKGLVARRGGDVHFDTEGLTPAHVSDRAPALTLVLMFQPPARGGGLRVWDVLYAGSDGYDDEDLERASVTCSYEPGDLVVIDSYRLHQIQPFTGELDRISATCHAAFVAGQWESWF